MAKSTTNKETAFLLGVQAFVEGKKCIPAWDKNLEPLLKNLQVGEGIPIYKQWLNGWHSANLLVS